ncbi:SDR family NAD(P)-dependent oxidoreductase [Paenibacillus sp. GCM10027626]|uniref:SDR family NAD(P)-dependent oxidoreductase n=1 Tax=Paenibacillus sp. GCM10027626 TaxID=3273411 RepID=UPI00363565B7
MESYADRTILVTGATGGIGKRIAAAYAAAGAHVVLTDSNKQLGEEVTAEIAAAGGEAVFVQADLNKPEQIERLFEAVRQQFQSLDILINNAGFGIWKSPLDLTVAEWDQVINVNLRGTFLCTREAAKLMKESGGGRIVNIASTRAAMSEPDSEAYAASKGGIVALTHALAVSFSELHITVNCISPGWIETGRYDELREADHRQHPAGRVGRPEDIVQACMYFTAAGNDFVTGVNLTIDGGMTKKMIYEP